MKYENGRVSGMNIAYIGGGSRGWAWTFMADLAMEPALTGTIRLYDIDRPAAENNRTIGNRLSAKPDSAGKWEYVVCPTLAEALDGADFVVISILPGTFDEMAVDVHMPERLGIYQSVGDTAGPGGTIRGLRTVPMFVEFAEAIRRCCPNAWVINYTNPMALCVRTLYRVFPGIKAFGCCHEVFNTQTVLASICERVLGVEGVARRDIEVNVLGLNHFTWFSTANYKGVDLFPLYRDFVDAHYVEGYDAPSTHWMDSHFLCAHRVKFDLFRRYGLIAAAGDRRKADLKERLARSARLVRGEEDIALEPTGEEGILLIKALCGLTRVVSNVNVPNSALQIPDLPADTVVETNALFGRDSIRPVAAGALPEDILALMEPHAANQGRILDAALTCDRQLVYQAFLTDPLVKGRAEDAAVRRLADDMIVATARYLPDGWR